jgi:dTMP kinase
MGHEVVHTREPGGTPLGERIREIILDPAADSLDGMTELMLCVASRRHHVRTRILPSLKADKPVICARYTASSVAYQGHARGVDLEVVRSLNTMATEGCIADLTIFINLPLAEANKRVQERPINADRLDQEPDGFKRKVVEAYRLAAEQEPESSFVVDGTDSLEVIHQKVRTELVSRWPAFPFRA